jgi:hypothetical protein
MPKPTAQQYVDQLHRNVEDWARNVITFEVFDARQRAVWNSIQDDGTKSEVLDAWREQDAPFAQSAETVKAAPSP